MTRTVFPSQCVDRSSFFVWQNDCAGASHQQDNNPSFETVVPMAEGLKQNVCHEAQKHCCCFDPNCPHQRWSRNCDDVQIVDTCLSLRRYHQYSRTNDDDDEVDASIIKVTNTNSFLANKSGDNNRYNWIASTENSSTDAAASGASAMMAGLKSLNVCTIGECKNVGDHRSSNNSRHDSVVLGYHICHHGLWSNDVTGLIQSQSRFWILN